MKKQQWSKSVAGQWDLFLPPARPSLSELAVCEQVLLKLKVRNKNLKVAILGSTPEYRDLCQTTNTNYKCIDYNKNNFELLKNYQLHKDDRSHLLISDWRGMKFKEKFDVFMGDLFTTVTPVKDHDLIFSNIKSHAKLGATLLIKVPLRNSNRQLTHKDIFRYYEKYLAYLNPFAAVWHEVLMADYDFAGDTMHCQISLKKLYVSYQTGTINKYEYQEFKKRWDALGNFKMNVPLKKDFLKKVRKYFAIVKITSGNDWYKKNVPIIICQAR